MSHKIEIKKAKAEDSPEIVQIRRKGAEDAFGASFALEDKSIFNALVEERADPEKLKKDLSDPQKHVFVAIYKGKLAGTSLLAVQDDNSGELSSTACAVHGEGIGSALINARIDLARELGLDRVWLETDTINPGGMAHASRHGFKEIASRPGKTVPGNHVITFEMKL